MFCPVSSVVATLMKMESDLFVFATVMMLTVMPHGNASCLFSL